MKSNYTIAAVNCSRKQQSISRLYRAMSKFFEGPSGFDVVSVASAAGGRNFCSDVIDK